MDKAKKILLISSLSALGVTCVLLITAIFGVNVFDGALFRILLVCACLSLSCGVLVNELSLIKKNKKLGFVSLSFLVLSTLFALIIFVSPLLYIDSVFNKITIVLSLFSIFFMIIVSFYVKMSKNMLLLQIITYVAVFLTDIILSLVLVGVKVFNIPSMSEIFAILCILSICLLIAVGILSGKKNFENNILENGEYIKVLKKDYDNLVEENKILKEKLKKLEK